MRLSGELKPQRTMPCESTRQRTIESGGCTYTHILECGESEAHDEHYDPTFQQSWYDNVPEPEIAVAPKLPWPL
jgi:hypothetical protein